MTNEELERKISKAFSDAVPDVYDRVIREIDIRQGRMPADERSGMHAPYDNGKTQISGQYGSNHETYTSVMPVNNASDNGSVTRDVTFVQKKKKGRALRIFFAAAAAAAVAVGTVLGVSSFNAVNAVASTVSIDVNPSIELKLNKDRRVLDVIPRSDDAQDVIGNMDLKGADLDVAVNALLGSMISKGYISDMANSILVSVDNADKETASALQDMLMEEIDAAIGNDAISGAVIGQVITEDDELSKAADEYGITLSKAQLIKQITAQNPTLKFEELVSLPINDLNLLKKGDTGELSSIGSASDQGYIGTDRAVEIALEYSDMRKEDAKYLKADIDYENGAICYAISFYEQKGDMHVDHDLDIEASTGRILCVEKEIDNTGVLSLGDMGDFLSPEEAKSIALSLAGTDEASIYEYEMERDHNRIDHYDIEFKTDGKEYDYAICMYGGTVIKDKWELEEDSSPTDDHSEPTSEEKKYFISEGAAKSTALKQAGVRETEIYELEIEIERDMGRLIYEVEFKSGLFSYSYDIDPITGEVVDYELDYDV